MMSAYRVARRSAAAESDADAADIVSPSERPPRRPSISLTEIPSPPVPPAAQRESSNDQQRHEYDEGYDGAVERAGPAPTGLSVLRHHRRRGARVSGRRLRRLVSGQARRRA